MSSHTSKLAIKLIDAALRTFAGPKATGRSEHVNELGEHRCVIHVVPASGNLARMTRCNRTGKIRTPQGWICGGSHKAR